MTEGDRCVSLPSKRVVIAEGTAGTVPFCRSLGDAPLELVVAFHSLTTRTSLCLLKLTVCN